MEEGDSPVTIWEDLDNDILKILQSFDVFELSAGLAHVCNAWRLACCDQLPLKTLDLSFQYKKKSEVVVMEKGDSPVRKWEDLDINIWVKILQSFDLFQLIYVIPQVCRAWQLACSDQLLWKMLDLSLDESILEKSSRLDKFLTLITHSCIKCQHTLNDEGLIRWYENEEDLWKVDEVRSLAI
ncbi:hypothetical protein H5410_016007 [Solanum commersonii]|uniref:F-box domain-containing protein n=1 Tax=Solanum commersonii TaxID=4109 RepID=A0A9J5ZWA8_SOLCO|nr:hypothetical protein H5410_016007 [Solanum commersonii]